MNINIIKLFLRPCWALYFEYLVGVNIFYKRVRLHCFVKHRNLSLDYFENKGVKLADRSITGFADFLPTLA